MSNLRQIQINTNGIAARFVAVQQYLFSKGIGWSAGGTSDILYASDRYQSYHERGINVVFSPQYGDYIVIGGVVSGSDETFDWLTDRDEIEKSINRLIRRKKRAYKDPVSRIKVLEVPF